MSICEVLGLCADSAPDPSLPAALGAMNVCWNGQALPFDFQDSLRAHDVTLEASRWLPMRPKPVPRRW